MNSGKRMRHIYRLRVPLAPRPYPTILHCSRIDSMGDLAIVKPDVLGEVLRFSVDMVIMNK